MINKILKFFRKKEVTTVVEQNLWLPGISVEVGVESPKYARLNGNIVRISYTRDAKIKNILNGSV
jgi:hypothetical protein